MAEVNDETKASYRPLSNLEDDEELSASKNARLLPRLWPRYLLACNVVILLLNIFTITVFMSGALTRNSLHATDYMLPPSRSLYVRLSRFEVSETDLSPALNEKRLQRQQQTFTLSSAWSGPPSNETDQAWKSLVEDDMGAFGISAKLFQQVNPSLGTGVRVPYEPEEEKYVATFDVVHKLHCLVSEAPPKSPSPLAIPVAHQPTSSHLNVARILSARASTQIGTPTIKASTATRRRRFGRIASTALSRFASR